MLPKSTLHGKQIFRPIMAKNKIGLSDVHKQKRLDFVINSVENGNYTKVSDTVHLDEKWFYLSRPSNRVYVPMEAEVALLSHTVLLTQLKHKSSCSLQVLANRSTAK
jgi:hypothetical protein